MLTPPNLGGEAADWDKQLSVLGDSRGVHVVPNRDEDACSTAVRALGFAGTGKQFYPTLCVEGLPASEATNSIAGRERLLTKAAGVVRAIAEDNGFITSACRTGWRFSLLL